MALKKDKKKVIGEHFDDERIRSFLDHQTYGDLPLAYHLLEKAYRGMKAENFATFLGFFQEAGHDINTTNAAGKTFLQEISEHRHADDYVAAMKAAGAR